MGLRDKAKKALEESDEQPAEEPIEEPVVDEAPQDDVECATCGSMNSADAAMCFTCGANLKDPGPVELPGEEEVEEETEDLNCPSCGAQNAIDSMQCFSCGARLRACVPARDRSSH